MNKRPITLKRPRFPPGVRRWFRCRFSVGGRLDIGVEDAGFKNLVSVEWDENAVETLRQNAARKGGVTRVIHADICTVDPLEIARPGIDLLHGGPPCQAFSLIGKRDSLGDYRGLLLFEMIRFAKALKPRAVLLEQVKGLLSAPDENGERGGVFKRFTHELGALGYTVNWSVLCAADFGVPQLRERVFIVALRGPNGFYFPPPTHAADPEETPLFSIKPYVGAGKVIGDLPTPRPKDEKEIFPNHVDVTPERDKERIHPVPVDCKVANRQSVGRKNSVGLTGLADDLHLSHDRFEPAKAHFRGTA